MTQTPSSDPISVPEHEVRSFLAEINGEQHLAYHSMAEASEDPDAAVVLSADYGGTIFLTVPVRLCHCSFKALETLISDLDAISWFSGDPTIAMVGLERHPVGTGVTGGDGGGIVIEGVWTHPKRLPPEVASQAVEVVLGKRDRIDVDLLRNERHQKLATLKARRDRRPNPKNVPWDAGVSEPHIPFS